MFQTTFKNVLSGALCLALLPLSAQALTAYDVAEKAFNYQDNLGFEGQKELKVWRQNNNKPKTARAEIRYRDKNNYHLKIIEPISIRRIEFGMFKGVNNAFFPDEKLYLFNGSPNTSDLPEENILGRVSDNPALLRKNYNAAPLKDDFVAATPTYVLEFTPKTGVATPKRKFWISKDNYQVLREERSWMGDNAPYSQSQYIIFKRASQAQSVPEVTAPAGVRKVELSGQEKNSFLSYSTVDEAETKEKIKIAMPDSLPPGFELKYIQVFSLFGARIQLLRFTDGLNSLSVTVRPEKNLFVTLLAGAFSINLIQKISELSYQIPSNYKSMGFTNQVAVAFGDVSSDELNKTLESLPLEKN